MAKTHKKNIKQNTKIRKHKFTNKSYSEKYFFLIIGLTIVFWAFAFPFIKIGLLELSPINLTIMRLFFVCLIYGFYFLLKKKTFSILQKKDIFPLFLLGFFGINVYHLCLNYGEQFISASAASLIIATIPLFVVIFATIFLEEPITIPKIFGVVISLSGVVIISTIATPNVTLEIRYLSGAFAVIVSAIVGAGYTIAGKKLLNRYSALSLTVYAFLLGSIGLIPFIGVSLIKELINLSLTGWGAVIFLAIFPTVIGYYLWYVALEIKTASQLSVYLYLIPVLSTIISYMLFQEQITFFFLMGGGLVIFGLYLVNYYKS